MELTDIDAWDEYISKLRETEYPMLKGTTYLDYAGMTPPSKTLMQRFAADQIAHLYGNPHSASPSSQLSARRTEDIRHDLLAFFQADPLHFDVVFVANATAGIKLVTEALRDDAGGFWYGYHKDSHTSLVGARESATAGHVCIASDKEFEEAIHGALQPKFAGPGRLHLLAYPAQSNLNGRRLPLSWCRRIRETSSRSGVRMLSLLDAAALVSTSRLDLSDAEAAPDFTVLSLYKIFGFPDLGALIVRKSCAEILRQKRYFGGGTVDVVTCFQEQWHSKKATSLHEAVEDGTLPVHSIMALGLALDVHKELFQSLEKVSLHTSRLAVHLYQQLESLRHSNGKRLCKFYLGTEHTPYADPQTQGPVLAFNIINSRGAWINNAEIEKLAAIRNIHIRTGGLCNPGGIARYLDLAAWEMKNNFSAGYRCGSEDDSTIGGKPNGVIRVSFGPMSTMQDVQVFVDFVREFFLETTSSIASIPLLPDWSSENDNFFVESLTVFPIKSCAGWRVPAGVDWPVRREGLAWDREWCLIHRGSRKALSQKRYPTMTLIRPELDLDAGLLTIRFGGDVSCGGGREISVPLSDDPTYYRNTLATPQNMQQSTVCGDLIATRVYHSASITEFFSTALGVPCQLARFPVHAAARYTRQSKISLSSRSRHPSDVPGNGHFLSHPILLANESPILIVSRSSVNRLNEQIKVRGGPAVAAESFRANVVVAQDLNSKPGTERPYAEDEWAVLRIGQQFYQVLGPCGRCQMVCVDQRTAERNEEPFVTLAKTRRFDSKVLFGQHASHLPLVDDVASPEAQKPTVALGDRVQALDEDEAEGILQRT